MGGILRYRAAVYPTQLIGFGQSDPGDLTEVDMIMSFGGFSCKFVSKMCAADGALLYFSWWSLFWTEMI